MSESAMAKPQAVYDDKPARPGFDWIAAEQADRRQMLVASQR
jgi:hypothetical protein